MLSSSFSFFFHAAKSADSKKETILKTAIQSYGHWAPRNEYAGFPYDL